eukprot:4478949-Prymnesium_polylepis.1
MLERIVLRPRDAPARVNASRLPGRGGTWVSAVAVTLVSALSQHSDSPHILTPVSPLRPGLLRVNLRDQVPQASCSASCGLREPVRAAA